MNDILRLLDDVKLLLQPSKSDNYAQPNRVFVYSHFLAPADFKVNPILLQHRFTDVTTHKGEYWGDLIIHGHTEDVLCAASFFCHLEGYRPDSASHNPLFVKNFYLKWPEYNKQMQIPGVKFVVDPDAPQGQLIFYNPKMVFHEKRR